MATPSFRLFGLPLRHHPHPPRVDPAAAARTLLDCAPLATDALLVRLATSAEGLTNHEAALRYAAGGPNSIAESEHRGLWHALLPIARQPAVAAAAGARAPELDHRRTSGRGGDRGDGDPLLAVFVRAGIPVEQGGRRAPRPRAHEGPAAPAPAAGRRQLSHGGSSGPRAARAHRSGRHRAALRGQSRSCRRAGDRGQRPVRQRSRVDGRIAAGGKALRPGRRREVAARGAQSRVHGHLRRERHGHRRRHRHGTGDLFRRHRTCGRSGARADELRCRHPSLHLARAALHGGAGARGVPDQRPDQGRLDGGVPVRHRRGGRDGAGNAADGDHREPDQGRTGDGGQARDRQAAARRSRTSARWTCSPPTRPAR